MKIKECQWCINNIHNKSITIDKNGICNVCKDYHRNFDKELLKDELDFIKKQKYKDGYNCMVGLSGGKDSTAMLHSVLDLGFRPLAFSFQIGYNNLTQSIIKNIESFTKKLQVDYEVIDIFNYINATDRACFAGTADIYDRAMTQQISKEEFRQIYFEGRQFYSTKQNVIFPFVRPCQICRKITIRAYYSEAVKRNIKIVFVGINEWASNKNGRYSAIRRLQPQADLPEVFIVHLPYLLQRRYSEVIKILESLSCDENVLETSVKTGGHSCILARACEDIAFNMLGFHLDSTRLSREVTVGFIDKETALQAITSGKYNSEKTVREVLIGCHII